MDVPLWKVFETPTLAALADAVFEIQVAVFAPEDVEKALAELDDYLMRHNTSASALIGRAADKLQSYGEQTSRPGYWKAFLPPETRD